MRAFNCLVIFFVALTAHTFSVEAWSYNQHRVVCKIALLDLQTNSPEAYSNAMELFEANDWGLTDPVEMCVLADEIKRRNGWTQAHKDMAKDRGLNVDRYMRKWHYVNVPARYDETVDATDCGGACVVSATRLHFDHLSSKSGYEQVDALILLSHWLGDIHQPMHAAFARDSGANGIYKAWFMTDARRDKVKDEIERNGRPKDYRKCENLHSIWDGCILDIDRGDVDSEAGRLYSGITAAERANWRSGDPEIWANGSLAVALEDEAYCDRDGIDCDMPSHDLSGTRDERKAKGKTYKEKYLPTVERRLSQAGIRLAWLVERALK